jgi:hypothetical protein
MSVEEPISGHIKGLLGFKKLFPEHDSFLCDRNSRNLNCHLLYIHVRCYQNPLQNSVLSTNNSQKEGSTA